MATISRKQICEAIYNPRTIEDDARKKLKSKIKKFGLLQPLVWNRLTGNLVSGHQRLRIMDEIEKREEYALDVAVVELSENDEKEMNVVFNNTTLMGEFDYEKLSEMVGGDLTYQDFGFDQVDIDLLFGENSRIIEEFDDSERMTKVKDDLVSLKQKRNNFKKESDEKLLNSDFYFVAVFESQAEKDAVLKKLRIPDYETYIKGRKISQALGIEIGED